MIYTSPSNNHITPTSVHTNPDAPTTYLVVAPGGLGGLCGSSLEDSGRALGGASGKPLGTSGRVVGGALVGVSGRAPGGASGKLLGASRMVWEALLWELPGTFGKPLGSLGGASGKLLGASGMVWGPLLWEASGRVWESCRKPLGGPWEA